MYLTCPTCSNKINANRVSYCVSCLNQNSPCSLFQGTTERVMHAAEAVVSLKKGTRPLESIDGEPKTARMSKLSESGIVKVVAVALSVVVMVGSALYLYNSLFRGVDSNQEVIHNLIHTQQLLKAYHKKNQSYPNSLSQVILPNDHRPLINPFNQATGQGKAWSDVGKMEPVPGLIMYQKIGDKFELTGYGDGGKILQNKAGQPMKVVPDTVESELK